MPENGQRAPPMMGRTARLHHDGGCFLLLEKCDQVFPLDFAADHDVSGLINSVNLEHRFGGVEANHGNGHRGRSLSGCFTTTGSWHIDAWGRPPHQPVRRAETNCRWPSWVYAYVSGTKLRGVLMRAQSSFRYCLKLSLTTVLPITLLQHLPPDSASQTRLAPPIHRFATGCHAAAFAAAAPLPDGR